MKTPKAPSECHLASCKHVNAKRTESQNNALWLFAEHASLELNSAGWSIKKTLTHYKVDLDWDKNSFIELVWRPIQKSLLGKTSTRQLKKQQDIDRVYEHINRFLSNPPFSIHVPFPNNPDKAGSATAKADTIEYPTEDYKEPLL